MPHAYTEAQLVEQPAIGLFAELGWITVSTKENMSSTSLVRIDRWLDVFGQAVWSRMSTE